MTQAISIEVTEVHAKAIEEAVSSGQFASASEVLRAALRAWLREREIDDLVDEGVRSGFGPDDRPIDSVLKEARAVARD